MTFAAELPRNPSLLRAVGWGGLVAGLLDATDAVIAYGIKGLNPIQVLQSVAAGCLGKAAFEMGLGSALIGLVAHFFISFVVAGIFVAASRGLGVLRTAWVPMGLIYGAAVYLTMTYLVLPLTSVPPSSFDLGLFINGVVGHAIFVGLPIAWAARFKTD